MSDVTSGVLKGKGLLVFVQLGNSVRGTVFPRELGPGGTVFPKGIRSAGPKIGPDRIPYDIGRGVRPSSNTLAKRTHAIASILSASVLKAATCKTATSRGKFPLGLGLL